MPALSQYKIVSVEDYLEGEIYSQVKHEYLGGAVHAMAGGTVDHAQVASNILGLLYSNLRGKTCRALNSDMKIRIELSNQSRFYYPDAMVVCQSNGGSEQFQERPVVIVEVLSDSTRRVDLTEKCDAYLTIPSLKVLIFVETSEPAVLVYRRQEAGEFQREEYLDLKMVIPIPEIGAGLALADLYERVDFSER